MFTNKVPTFLITVILATLAAPCFALDSLIVNINQATIMTNPTDSNDVRALVRFDLPQNLDTTKFVTFAELRFAVNTTQRFERPIRLRVCPITRTWSPGNISWSGPWTNPGGDFADSIGCIGHIDSSRQFNVRIDVANIIQHYIRGYMVNNGLIISQHGNLKRTYGLTPNRYPGGAVAQLAIYYVSLNSRN